METIHLRACSDANGVLHLDIPVDKQDVEFEITLTLVPTGLDASDSSNYATAVEDDEECGDLDEFLCD